jgi:hypothetical protein
MKREPNLSDYDNDRDAYETARTGYEDYEDTERRRYWEERDEMERERNKEAE